MKSELVAMVCFTIVCDRSELVARVCFIIVCDRSELVARLCFTIVCGRSELVARVCSTIVCGRSQLVARVYFTPLVFYVYIFRQTMGDLQTCLILSVEKFQKSPLQYHKKSHY